MSPEDLASLAVMIMVTFTERTETDYDINLMGNWALSTMSIESAVYATDRLTLLL